MTVASQFGTDVLISGWGHTVFGKLTDRDLESLIVEAATRAIESAGIDPGDVDEIYLGHFNSSLLPLAFTSSLALQVDPALRNVPATRVENACASGSAAVHAGMRSLLAGTARSVLVIGAEKMTQATPEHVGSALLGADYESAGHPSTVGFTGLFAAVATAYSERYGISDLGDVLGDIAAKNHRNGVSNPYAQLRKDLGVEFCRTTSDRNPLVADPLRRTDCSPVSDGAAALVLTTSPSAAAEESPVRITGFGQASDFHPASRRDPVAFLATRTAVERAYEMAGIGVDDLSLAEVHDCFTIAELVMYEAIGLAAPGEGRHALDAAQRGGSLPVNLSGGLKSKGHPVGATGVSQHVVAAMQLSGVAGDMQLEGAERALVQNMGGVGVANYATVLEAV